MQEKEALVSLDINIECVPLTVNCCCPSDALIKMRVPGVMFGKRPEKTLFYIL